MEIRHLEYFIEVARYKSFSKAAEVTHISQPSISKAIKELEMELGKTLFYRSTKYVKLTDIGEAIFEQAQQLVASFRNINAQMEDVENIQTGKIHIGIPPITAFTSFSKMLEAFKASYPKIQIQLFEYGPKKIEASLLDGLLDIGIFTPEDSGAFEWIWFERDPHKIIMHPSHPLAQYQQLDFKNLDGQQLITYNKEYKLYDCIMNSCLLAGAVPEIALETSQLELILQMVATKMGIALLPSKLCGRLDPNSITSRLFADSQLLLQLALVWKRDRYIPYAADRFLKFVQQNYKLEKFNSQTSG